MLSFAQSRLIELSSAQDALFLQRFFKTGPGEYGEGDLFRGIRVPLLRTLARECEGLGVSDLQTLLDSPWHEDRLLALLVMVRQYAKGDAAACRALHALYLANAKRVNNWDLVDQSAQYLVGAHLFGTKAALLRTLARSTCIWERRIAIIATLDFIRKGRYEDTRDIAELLLNDTEDLIHKACGWMLREVGKRDREAEEVFLRKHCRVMPRTMLRYALEHFPQDRRNAYMKGLI